MTKLTNIREWIAFGEGQRTNAQSWHAFEWFNGEPATSAGSFWVEHAQKLARQAHDLAFKAVTEWAAQAQMTPEKWLEHWEPAIEYVWPDSLEAKLEFTIRVTARVRRR